MLDDLITPLNSFQELKNILEENPRLHYSKGYAGNISTIPGPVILYPIIGVVRNKANWRLINGKIYGGEILIKVFAEVDYTTTVYPLDYLLDDLNELTLEELARPILISPCKRNQNIEEVTLYAECAGILTRPDEFDTNLYLGFGKLPEII